MKSSHKLIDKIAVTMFLFCLTSLAILFTLCLARNFLSIGIHDIIVLVVAILGGILFSSPKRVECFSVYLHKTFDLSM